MSQDGNGKYVALRIAILIVVLIIALSAGINLSLQQHRQICWSSVYNNSGGSTTWYPCSNNIP